MDIVNSYYEISRYLIAFFYDMFSRLYCIGNKSMNDKHADLDKL